MKQPPSTWTQLLFHPPQPTGLILVLFLALLGFQALLASSMTSTLSLVTGTFDSTWSFGIGSPVKVITAGRDSSVDIDWFVLIVNLGLCYCLSIALGQGIQRATGLRRPGLPYVAVIGAVCVASLLASVFWSRWYWGYWFARPAVLAEIDEVTAVRAVIPVRGPTESVRPRQLTVDTDVTISDLLKSTSRYECLFERVPVRLKERRLLPGTPAHEIGEFAGLCALLAETGLPAKAAPGYDPWSSMSGVIVDATGATGERLIFLGLRTGEVSNDHYPYYECLFAEAPGGGLVYRRGQRFFFDVAGMEGAEWYGIWVVLTALGSFVALPFLTAILLVRAFTRRRPSCTGKSALT